MLYTLNYFLGSHRWHTLNAQVIQTDIQYVNLANSHILEALSSNHIWFLNEQIIILHKLHTLMHRLGDCCCLQSLHLHSSVMVQSVNTTRAKSIFYIFHPMCVTTGINIIYHGSQIPNDYNASLCIICYIQHHSHSRHLTIFVVSLFMVELWCQNISRALSKYINICVQYNISYLPLWLYFELNCENERVRDAWKASTAFGT
jgi:hypothetical protein